MCEKCGEIFIKLDKILADHQWDRRFDCSDDETKSERDGHRLFLENIVSIEIEENE
jgi:hypothetical protein